MKTSRPIPCLAALVLAAIFSVPVAAAEPAGSWMLPRKDAANSARADLPGAMREAPREIWSIRNQSGADYAAPLDLAGRPAILTLTGSNLALSAADGALLWSRPRLGVSAVDRIADFDGDGQVEIFVRTDPRTVMLLDALTGDPVWSWQCEPSAFTSGHQFFPSGKGLRYITFPAYSLNGYCFDFAGDRANPRLAWQNSYDYHAGFGPSVVIADFTGDGQPEIAISGKTPVVYQSILELDTGKPLSKVIFKADPAEDPEMGRPYGLVHAADLDADGLADLVLVSCQVEEYVAVSRNTGTAIERVWGKFIEKDWPYDHYEIRPQVTSVTDVTGDGKPELVLGWWDAKMWHTLVLDPLIGFDRPLCDLPGLFFWGCHDLDADGLAEIIVSREPRRRVAGRSTLSAIDGRSFEPRATLDRAAILASSDSEIPCDRFFMANRSNPLFLARADGTQGILVERDATETGPGGICLWGAAPGEQIAAHFVAAAGRPQLRGGSLILGDAAGSVQRFTGNLTPSGSPVQAPGGLAMALVAPGSADPELILDQGNGVIIGGRPDLDRPGELLDGWRLEGSFPALHVDTAGTRRLVIADNASDTPTLLVYSDPLAAKPEPLRVPLPWPVYQWLTPFGADFSVLVNYQTGVHTRGLEVFDAYGRSIWSDPDLGAHPRRPAAADLNDDGRCEVIADDHGKLTVYGANGASIGTDHAWAETPNYSLPIVGPFGAQGDVAILRASGITEVGLAAADAHLIWHFPTDDVWTYYKSLSAAARPLAGGPWTFAALTEDGVFRCIDASTGKDRWQIPLDCAPSGESIVAGDLDGNGEDEFLIGLPDGRLLCIGERGGKGGVVWMLEFDAAVANPVIADIDGDDKSEIIVSTSDGFVRILK